MQTDTSRQERTTRKITTIASWTLAFVLVLVPFHAILTVSLSQIVGHYEYLRLWKEAILLLLTPLVAYLAWKTPGLWRQVRSGWLVWCVAAYVLLHIALGLIALAKHQVNGYSLAYALTINLRLLLVFALAFVLAARWSWLRDHWKQILLGPALVVIGFAMLQLFLLPHDFLRNFGYGAGTIVPYETVDQKLDYVRIQSTLRGSNPFGAYLVLVLSAVVALLLRAKREKRQVVGVFLLSAGLLALVATYSRSAYAGMVIATVAAVAMIVSGRKAKRRLAYGLAAAVLLAAGAVATLRTNDRFENTFFHTDEHSTSEQSSNEARLGSFRMAVDDVVQEPFGRGPGTAGPASQHNLQPGRIAENYYLQIAQETGWLGLGLFLAILVLISKRLWQHRDDLLARVLLASLIGISFINMVQHAWADDTLALLWWGLAGIAVAPALYVKRAKIPKTEPGKKKS